MKSCNWVINRFSDYIDDELSRMERDEIDGHVSACSTCAAELESFRMATAALESLAVPLRPRPALSAIRARIRQEDKQQKRNLWLLVPIPAVAAAALAVFFIFNGHTPQTRLAVVSTVPSVTVPAASVRDDNVKQTPPIRVVSTPEKTSLGAHSVGVQFRKTIATSSRIPLKVQAIMAAVKPAEQRIMVVAYRPASSYCATVQDPKSGESIAEVSVTSSYASDGTVKDALVTMHFPPAGKPVEDNKNENDRSEIRSDMRSHLNSASSPV